MGNWSGANMRCVKCNQYLPDRCTCNGPSIEERRNMSNNQNQGASIEAAAKAIYERFPGAADHPWVERGNSHKQEDARWYARAAFTAFQAAHAEPATAPFRHNLAFLCDLLPGDFMWGDSLQAAVLDEILSRYNARRTPAAAVGAGELPPLPEPFMMLHVPVVVEAWQNQMQDYARAAIAADRAQQALDRQALTDRITHLEGELNLAKAELRVQLAAKGQGEPCGWLAGGGGNDGCETMFYRIESAQRECDEHNAYERSRPDFDAENLRKPEPVYRAVPASAQPADALERAMARIEAHKPQYTEEWLKSVVEAGAQPDQRDSAAE